MKKLFFGAVALLLVPFLAASTSSTTSTPAEHIFRLSAALACADRFVGECRVLQVSRTELAGQVAYYRALIKVGSGNFDVIGVSRLIHEPQEGIPTHTTGSFLFIHGSSAHFRLMMVNLRHGLGIFLAKHNIDVWGIDLRNVQIPADTTDLSFGRNWGFDVQIKDVMLATRIARWVRALTGQGNGGIILGGHSSGAALTYAVANAEAILPKANRDVVGIIPIDWPYKLPPWASDQSDFSCSVEAVSRDAVTHDGPFFDDNSFGIEMARLARTDPTGISPNGAPLTNLQFLMENAGGLYFWPLYPFHPLAVMRNKAGVAVRGRYSSVADIIAVFEVVPAYSIANAMGADMFGTSCVTTDSPYDDNLGEVRVPALYIGVAGGFGPLGEYTTQLLGSDDVTKIMMQSLPDADATNDFGHMEPFSAHQAQGLIWEPIRAWIVERSH